MLADAQDLVDRMGEQSQTSLHPNLTRGMDTRSNLSWTIVGFDAVNTCFPDIMDLLNVPLDVKILKDLQQIEENLPRVVVQSPEMLRVVSAWTNLCRKARDGKLVSCTPS